MKIILRCYDAAELNCSQQKAKRFCRFIVFIIIIIFFIIGKTTIHGQSGSTTYEIRNGVSHELVDGLHIMLDVPCSFTVEVRRDIDV